MSRTYKDTPKRTGIDRAKQRRRATSVRAARKQQADRRALARLVLALAQDETDAASSTSTDRMNHLGGRHA